MGTLNDFKATWGKKATGAIVGALLDGAIRLLRVAVPEAAAIATEYLNERSSPDGWTRRERLTFYIGRLTVVRQKQTFKNPLVERAFDSLLDTWIADLDGDLDDLDDDLTPEPEPSTPEPAFDPYWKIISPEEFEAVRRKLAAGTRIYRRDLGGVAPEYFLASPGIGAPIPEGFILVETLPF